MDLDEFMLHLAKTPAKGFTWGLNDDGCIRAGFRRTSLHSFNAYCPITAVLYSLKGIEMPGYEVCWQPNPLGLSVADTAEIMIASDSMIEIRRYTSELRLRLMLAVGLVKHIS